MQQVSEGINDGRLDIEFDCPCVDVIYLGLEV